MEPVSCVTVGGVILTSAQYSYTRINNYSGIVTVFAVNVTGDIVVRGTATRTSNAPITQAATVIEHNSFRANWNSVPGATAYIIDVSVSSNFSSYVSGYLSRNVGNVTHVDVFGLNPSTTYYYRVRAQSANGSSAFSDVRAVTTLASPFLTVSPVDIRVSSIRSYRFVDITSNRDWTVSSDVTWARAITLSGSGNARIIVDIDENISYSQRIGRLTVSAGGVIGEVKIVQDGGMLPVRDVSVAFYYHRSYQNAFINNYSGNAMQMLRDANTAYVNEFRTNFIFQQGVYVTDNLLIDNCDLGLNVICSHLCCGESHTLHYKNYRFNINHFNNNIFNPSTSRLGVLAYRANMCIIRVGDTTCSYVGGAANSIGGRTNMVDFQFNRHVQNVRILQHELAHNFGIKDSSSGVATVETSPCTVGQDCLMIGDYFNDGTWSLRDIWCDEHKREFIRDLH